MTEAPGGIVAALVAFQAALPNVGKVSTAQYGAYADLADVSGIVLPRLAAVGLAYTAYLVPGEDRVWLRCQLMHTTSGELFVSDWPIPLGTSQAMGSAITYGRRYCLLALCGVHPAGEDDDAQLATKEHQKLAKDTVKTPRKATRTSTTRGEEDPWADVPPVTQTPPRRQPPSPAGGAEPTPTGDGITPLQLRKLGALMRDAGIVDRADALDYVSGAIGRAVESRNDLTRAEAGKVIDALEWKAQLDGEPRPTVDVNTGELT